MSTRIDVRGNASAEELAVVLAVVARGGATAASSEPAQDGYARWRVGRLHALRARRTVERPRPR